MLKIIRLKTKSGQTLAKFGFELFSHHKDLWTIITIISNVYVSNVSVPGKSLKDMSDSIGDGKVSL